MVKRMWNYPWRDFVGDVGDELHLLRQRTPPEDAPAFLWIEWHEKQADCWRRLGLKDSAFIEHDTWLGDEHRRKAKELWAAPDSVDARRGYWTL